MVCWVIGQSDREARISRTAANCSKSLMQTRKVSAPITHDTNSYSDLSPLRRWPRAGRRSSLRIISMPFLASASDLSSWVKFGSSHLRGSWVYTWTWTPDGQMMLDRDLAVRSPHGSKHRKQDAAPPPHNTIKGGRSSLPRVRDTSRSYCVLPGLAALEGKPSTIWRMDAGGGNLKTVSSGTLDASRGLSAHPMGSGFITQIEPTARRSTKVPLDGGKAENAIQTARHINLDISLDGKLAAFTTFPSAAAAGNKSWH